ncbi:hypothetical protein BY996DRAFT_6510678 [Phakopsora pachyrhizi]|nr:hypothetical protein BY996DRAFT_6510678 [Phakopsora pachyrhizi]
MIQRFFKEGRADLGCVWSSLGRAELARFIADQSRRARAEEGWQTPLADQLIKEDWGKGRQADSWDQLSLEKWLDCSWEPKALMPHPLIIMPCNLSSREQLARTIMELEIEDLMESGIQLR